MTVDRNSEQKTEKEIPNDPGMGKAATPDFWPNSPKFLLLLLLLLLTGTLIIGFLYSRDYEKQIRSLAEQRLSFVAEFKADELIRWRNERRMDAEFIYKDDSFSELVNSHFKEPGNLDVKRKLDAWIKNYLISNQYSAIHLFDTVGRVRLYDPAGASSVSEVILKHIEEVCISRKIEFQDFYRNEHNGKVSLGLLIPILDEKDTHRVLAVLLLGIDPETFLYPFIQRWPLLNRTAETLLVRKEGNDVLFLNELKFKNDAALKLRIPLSDIFVPAVKAVLGATGIVEGIDYRGVKVVASVRAIPDSPWFLVSRMDSSEVYESLRSGIRNITGLVIIFVFFQIAVAAFFLKEQKIRFLRGKEEILRKTNQELEGRISQRTAALTLAMEEMEAFSYSVAHDLKAPLRAIAGFANILTEDYAPKLDENGQRVIGVINENVRKMGQLIEDLLKLAHLVRVEMNFVDTDIMMLVESLCHELREDFPRDRTIEVSVKPLPSARADLVLARQILTNLISNAMKFSAHQEKATIEIGGYDKDGECVYYVKDNGAGFDMKYEGKLFGIFQRFHAQDEFEGTGIGLAIVRSAVRRLGGRVWAEARVGQGATFYFTLPKGGQNDKRSTD